MDWHYGEEPTTEGCRDRVPKTAAPERKTMWSKKKAAKKG